MELLLALMRDRTTVLEVQLNQAAHRSLVTRVTASAAAFLNDDVEQHDYSPGFKPEEGGVVALKFDLPEPIWRCRTTLPNDVAALKKDDLASNFPIALVWIATGRAPRFVFQVVDGRNLLRRERTIIFNPNGFALSAEPGLIVPDHVAAIYEGGRLYFSSEATVRRFLDLGEVFREATDEEIDEFFGGDAFVVDDMGELKASATTLLRKKLHTLTKSGRAFSPGKLKNVAARVGINLKIKDGAIVVPTERAALRDFVRLLNDDYLASLHDADAVYLTTSKRPLE